MNVSKEMIDKIAAEMVITGIHEGFANKVKNYAYIMPPVAKLMLEWHNQDNDDFRNYILNAIKYLMGDEDQGILV